MRKKKVVSSGSIVLPLKKRVHCPFRDRHGCTNGVNSNGFTIPYFLTHFDKQHVGCQLSIDRVRDELKDDCDLYLLLENSLKSIDKWMCGRCLGIHAFGIPCRHPDAIIPPPILLENGESPCFIVGIPQSPPKPDTIDLASTTQRGGGDTPDPLVVPSSLNEKLLDNAFRIPFRTVKSIPRACRLAFSGALKSALWDITTDPSSVMSWVRLLLLPRCTLQVFLPQNRQERRSGTRKNFQQKQILHALTTWNEPGRMFRLLESVTESPSVQPTRKSASTQNVRRCLQKVADGHFAAAVKVLSSAGVASNSAETICALEEKHPMRQPPVRPTVPFAEPPLVVERDALLSCIRSFPKGTSCGRDGLRAQHLLDAMSGAAAAISSDLLDALTPVVNLWLQGRCPQLLAEFIASAPLTPLLKPDNSIRPIVVRMVWRRLVSKIAMKGVSQDVVGYLQDFQYGVGVSGGAEAILHAVNRIVYANSDSTSLSMLLVDFQNAFNMVDQTTMLREVRIRCPAISPWVEYLYCQPARLYMGDSYIWSATGVQQGNPLGPLLFALVLHPLILRIQSSCQLLLHAWYLDDGTLIGDTEQVATALSMIQEEGPSYGLVLNVAKTELFWPSLDPRHSTPGLFPSDLSRPQQGVRLLGGTVSTDPSFVRGLACKRVEKVVTLMDRLATLDDPQCELALLRACAGLSKLVFAIRTCPPSLFREAAKTFDRHLRSVLQGIVVSDGPNFGDLQWRLSTLPLRLGGLGIYCATDVSTFAFVASRCQTSELQNHILRSCGPVPLDEILDVASSAMSLCLPDFDLSSMAGNATVPSKPQKVLAEAFYSKIAAGLEREFVLSARQKAVIGCLQSEHAKDFLLAIPMEGLGQHMSSVEYRSILRYRLMIPLYSDGGLCPVCKKSRLDAFGDHAAHCIYFPGFKYRRDHVRDILCDAFWRAGVQVKKEAPVNFLTDPNERRSTLRPADILIYSWSEGRHACVDVTGASPLVGLGNGVFEVGGAAKRAAAGKMEKHEEACTANQHCFIPFSFDTFGFLEQQSVELLKRLQKVMDSNVMTAGSNEFVFRRIRFAIQKRLAAQLVARLS